MITMGKMWLIAVKYTFCYNLKKNFYKMVDMWHRKNYVESVKVLQIYVGNVVKKKDHFRLGGCVKKLENCGLRYIQ